MKPLFSGITSFSFLGIRVHPITMAKTLALIQNGIERNLFIQHAVVNVAKIVHAQSDAELKSSVESCDIVNIDGMGVVWGSRFLKMEVPERVAGIDLFYNLIELSERKRYPVYLLGAKPDIIQKTVRNLQDRYPGLVIAGSHHGYFWENEEKVVDSIRNSGAKLLFVAISSPKKENFINRWNKRLGVNFVMGVGGTFDIVAGFSKRAPLWVQKSGLEWLYRVIQEPRRMWKRYLVTNSTYAIMLLREKYRMWKTVNK